MKADGPVPLVTLPPKKTAPSTTPATRTLPEGSIVMALPESRPVLPARFDHAIRPSSPTVTAAVALVLESPLSVTVKVAVKLPGEVYVCVTTGPLADTPSPKAHEYETIVPSGSYEAEPSKRTVVNVCVDCVAPAMATGGWFISTATTLLGA